MTRAETFPFSCETWQDVADFVQVHRLDMDEYFSFKDADPKARIWDSGADWIGAFVVAGGSEGWYVHVEEIYRSGLRILRGLGKFWSFNAAARAAALISAYIYSDRCYSRFSVVPPAYVPAGADNWYRYKARLAHEVEGAIEIPEFARVEPGEALHYGGDGLTHEVAFPGAWVEARVWVEGQPEQESKP